MNEVPYLETQALRGTRVKVNPPISSEALVLVDLYSLLKIGLHCLVKASLRLKGSLSAPRIATF